MSARILPAEYVFPGHPDKLCDAIADALVAEAIRREARALVGVEVAVHRNHAVVTGRITCNGAYDIDVDGVRGIYRSAGYGKDWHPTPEELRPRTSCASVPWRRARASSVSYPTTKRFASATRSIFRRRTISLSSTGSPGRWRSVFIG